VTIEDELVAHRENKTRYHDDVSYTEGCLAWMNFCLKNQLMKGKLGEHVEEAEYYFSEQEGCRTFEAAPHRYPIIRTQLARPQKSKAFRSKY
jgi:hypothetical protein